MIINHISEIYKKKLIFSKDSNNREIWLYDLSNVSVTGDGNYYPNCLLYSDNKLYNPLDERIMSLEKLSKVETFEYVDKDFDYVEKRPVFFFIYNTDNYYHFVYDTLPYLISYFLLKKEMPNLKILMNYPNGNNKHYKFVLEFLELLGLKECDILIVDERVKYQNMYISSSYTHGHDSNLPPRKEVYQLFKDLVESAKVLNPDYIGYENIYISRRSWKHNDTSNIGTNYTTRRLLSNEDTLVESLESLEYVEVFTELLSTVEKILMFNGAKKIIGAIGGGLVNCVFSNKTCKLTTIVSPCFLDVNARFVHSFKNTDVRYFTDTKHLTDEYWKDNMRIFCENEKIVGEIYDISELYLSVKYSKEKVSGWNNKTEYHKKILHKDKCIRLDEGLNSTWTVNIEGLLKIL